MLHDSTPPLLRGLGTTFIFLATILSFVVARQEIKTEELARLHPTVAASSGSSQPDDDAAIDEVLSNPWIAGLSYLGTGLISASFYAEWFIRRRKRLAN